MRKPSASVIAAIGTRRAAGRAAGVVTRVGAVACALPSRSVRSAAATAGLVTAADASARANSSAEPNRSAGHRRQRPCHRRVHLLRHTRPCLAHPRHLAAESLGDDRLRRGAGERRLTGQHLVQHAAERVDVGPRVERLVARRLLRDSCRPACPPPGRSRSGDRPLPPAPARCRNRRRA